MRLPRLQLFEFCDLSWFHGLPREMFQDYLRLVHVLVHPYHDLAPKFAAWAQRYGFSEFLDLCSGAGGHIVSMHETAVSRELPKFILSDLYPQLGKFALLRDRFGSEKIDFIEEAVPAVNVPSKEKAIRARCLFTAFHHFKPVDAEKILNSALDECDALFIAEFFERKLQSLLVMPFGIIGSILLPFCGTFSLRRVLLSPIVALIGVHDGLVSVLRTYSLEEIFKMIPEEKQKTLVIEQEFFPYFGGSRAYCVMIRKRLLNEEQS